LITQGFPRRWFNTRHQLGGGILVTILGVDIVPGSSPQSRRQPSYSAVVLRDGEIVASFEGIKLHRLLRLVLEYHVDIIAVDNIYELAPSTNSLRRIIELIPPGVKIVQTTGSPQESRSIEEVAREIGLPGVNASPIKTAYINAMAAYRGLGYEVRLFSEKTKIVITRGRSISQGGMSRDRFVRSVRASILQATREVKGILDENRLDYDMVIKKSQGGLEKSVFIVYAPREKLYGLIKPFKYKNVKILVKPYTSRDVLGIEQAGSREPVIVGIDPGMSMGIAILSLDGEPRLVTSIKNPDRDEVVNVVNKYGEAVVVATDVTRPSETVIKLASMLNATLYVPDKDISIDEKNKIAREFMEKYMIDVPDAHGRDALSAAVKAYNSYKNTIEEVKSKISGIEGIDRLRIIAEVIKGRPLAEVLEEYFEKKLPSQHSDVSQVKTVVETHSECTRLREKINTLEALVRRLIEESEKKDLYIRDLELELKLMRSRKPGSEEYERKINMLQNELDTLRRRLEDKDAVLRELYEKLLALEDYILKLGRGELVMLPKLSYVRSDGSWDFPGVYMEKAIEIPRDIRELIEKRRGFIASSIIEVDPLKEKIPVVKPDLLIDLGEYVLVERGIIGKAQELWRRIDYMVESERHESIIRMIEEYQKSRMKGRDSAQT